MKIVAKDNYNREEKAERVVADNVSKYMGEIIVKLLNDNEHPHSATYFTLEENDYRLWRGLEELI